MFSKNLSLLWKFYYDLLYFQELLNRTSDVTRDTVQKSVCVLSKLVCIRGKNS